MGGGEEELVMMKTNMTHQASSVIYLGEAVILTIADSRAYNDHVRPPGGVG